MCLASSPVMLYLWFEEHTLSSSKGLEQLNHNLLEAGPSHGVFKKKILRFLGLICSVALEPNKWWEWRNLGSTTMKVGSTARKWQMVWEGSPPPPLCGIRRISKVAWGSDREVITAGGIDPSDGEEARWVGSVSSQLSPCQGLVTSVSLFVLRDQVTKLPSLWDLLVTLLLS